MFELDEEGRRDAVILVTAVKGDVREARGVVSRGLRRALRFKRLGAAPYHISYYSESEMAALEPGLDPPPRYTLLATNEEMDRVYEAIKEEASKAGFDHPPVDIYHD